jgi:hypothetical protein
MVTWELLLRNINSDDSPTEEFQTKQLLVRQVEFKPLKPKLIWKISKNSVPTTKHHTSPLQISTG